MASKQAGVAANKALDTFMAKMAKSYGDGTFTLAPTVTAYDVIPTGSITLDYNLSVGGYVVGRLHEMWGSEGAGKTTLNLITAAEAQKKFPDRVVAWIDVEHRLDKAWAVSHGVDLSRLLHIVPNDAEEVADQVKDLCRSGLVSFIVVDSIGAMIPEKEKEKDAGDAVVGKQAQIVTRMVKIAAVEAFNTNTTVMFINQVRANVGGYGSPTTTGGGFALKHATTTKLMVKRQGGLDPLKARIDGEDRVVGHHMAVNIERNSVAPAYRVATFPMFHVATEKYGPIGIDAADEATTIGIKTGVIQQAGAWYTITPTGERVQGRDSVVEALRTTPSTIAQVRERALAAVAKEVTEEPVMEPEGDDE